MYQDLILAWSLMLTLIFLIDLFIFLMGCIIMVVFIEIIFTILVIDALDMDIFSIMEIGTLMEDAIEHVIMYMDTMEIEISMNALQTIGQGKEIQITEESLVSKTIEQEQIVHLDKIHEQQLVHAIKRLAEAM